MKQKSVIGQTLKPDLCYPNETFQSPPTKKLTVYLPTVISFVCVGYILSIFLID